MKNHQGIRVTPTLAARRHCVECVGSVNEVNACSGQRFLATDKPCTFFQYRHGERRVPLKVIRQECLACCGSPSTVARCPSVRCNLHPYRLGKNPAIRVSDETRAKNITNLQKARAVYKAELTFDESEPCFAEIR
jgi:hypothetical protein